MSHHASGPNFGFPRGDARLDMTDLYVFPKPGDPDKSIIVLNVHPSFRLDSPEPTTKEPFAPGALYEVKVDTDGDAVADLGCRVQFASSQDGKQTATVRRIDGARAAGVGDDGEVVVEAAPVSVGKEALVTEARDFRFSSVGAAIHSFSTQSAISIKCSSRATTSSQTKMFAASCLKCPTRNWEITRWEFGLAQWTKLEKVGSRQIGGEGHCKR